MAGRVNPNFMTKKNNFYILLAVTLSAFLTPFMGSAVNVALPAIGREFSMPALSLCWVATSFILGAAIMLVPLGRVSDIYGHARIFLFGALIFTISSLFCIWSPSSSVLIFFRALQGIGGGVVFCTRTARFFFPFPHHCTTSLSLTLRAFRVTFPIIWDPSCCSRRGVE